MTLNDAHCHFFSTPFFAALGRQMKAANPGALHETAIRALGWEPPGSTEDLSDRWVRELDRANVARAALIASVHGDATAVRRHPHRFVG